ncbi:hypothetical protein R3P38DRAFT_3539598 [Favolaschia claudopus]|uniref:Uncharacterized protein n=1 Tax=Favolaschia claudopus TaxID=2862362 RepID=A0AAW0BA14_9AGAR
MSSSVASSLSHTVDGSTAMHLLPSRRSSTFTRRKSGGGGGEELCCDIPAASLVSRSCRRAGGGEELGKGGVDFPRRALPRYVESRLAIGDALPKRIQVHLARPPASIALSAATRVTSPVFPPPPSLLPSFSSATHASARRRRSRYGQLGGQSVYRWSVKRSSEKGISGASDRWLEEVMIMVMVLNHAEMKGEDEGGMNPIYVPYRQPQALRAGGEGGHGNVSVPVDAGGILGGGSWSLIIASSCIPFPCVGIGNVMDHARLEGFIACESLKHTENEGIGDNLKKDSIRRSYFDARI